MAQGVKSRARRGGCGAPLAGLLLGAISWAASAAGAPGRTCSTTRPVCVEGDEAGRRRAALALLTTAYETMVLGGQGPSWPLDPLGDPMVWRLADGPLTFEVSAESGVGFDQGRPVCRGGALTEGSALACAAGSTIGRHVPRTAPVLLRGASAYLTRAHGGWVDDDVFGPSSPLPEVGWLSDTSVIPTALLFDQVAAKASQGLGVEAVWLGLTLAATKTVLGSVVADPEPDFFDVLRSTVGESDAHFARLFDEAAARRFSGAAPLGGTMPRPEIAWEIDGDTLPRNLVLPRPLLPTGSAYVLVHLDPRTRKSGLALRTFCESGSRYVWSMARLDQDQRIQSRVLLPGRELATTAEGMLYELDRAESVLVMGTSLGGQPQRPLDPDQVPHAAHSCEVVLNRLP